MVTLIRMSLASGLLPVLLLLTGCSTTPAPIIVEPPPVSKPYKIPIVVKSKHQVEIPAGTRIVIADIAGRDFSDGNCAADVKDALMRRLIDNEGYDVLTRENLDQILGETDLSWAGRFNTETTARIGELLGASLWIVGRVAYCGQSASSEPEYSLATQYNVYAMLQVIDIATGRIVVSSASEGTYIPRLTSRLDLQIPGSEEAMEQPEGVGPEGERSGGRVIQSVREYWDRMGRETEAKPVEKRRVIVPEPPEYSILRAAEAMANDFADKFFARPFWVEVEMWGGSLWKYSDAVTLVKLGRCQLARDLIEREAALELVHMDKQGFYEYLHNYGVALLCANEPERAIQKLRAAYRIVDHEATQNMLGLAAKLLEWSLVVEEERQPEIQMLISKKPDLAGH